jgi:hypothetical protein
VQGGTGGANGALTSDLGDLLQLDDDAEPATASQPATATPNYLHDLLGAGLETPTLASTSAAATPIDLLDLLEGDNMATTTPASTPATLVRPARDIGCVCFVVNIQKAPLSSGAGFIPSLRRFQMLQHGAVSIMVIRDALFIINNANNVGVF